MAQKDFSILRQKGKDTIKNTLGKKSEFSIKG